MTCKYSLFTALAGLSLLWLASEVKAERVTVPLNGTWQIEDGRDADRIPERFSHTVPVPGMANLAEPAFADVDQFDSRELIDNRIRKKQLPESDRTTEVGVPRQNRNYFWYARSFRVPGRKQVAMLRINKAQFGTAVWLNGKKVGEHAGCFSAGIFNVSDAIDWQGENRLVVRVGAHPAAMPASVPAGTDFEKTKWTAGIYDRVSLLLSDNPVIESIQVAPHIQSSEIVVETRLKNYAAQPQSCQLGQQVKTWKEGRAAAQAAPLGATLQGGEEKTLEQTIAIPNARLWSPDDPFLYQLDTHTGGDNHSTRFGMREFRFDTRTHRAYLNGKVCYLRGSNITLHRFFEDPLCGSLPWNETWLRKLLIDIPRQMHWNSFRFCIGPVPEQWLDIADEAGLLIQYEYFIWTGPKPETFHKEWTAEELIRQYGEWMRDSWNHPSVAIWDACNETIAPVLGQEVIPKVRTLDLSGRAWENGYNPPVGPDDPVESHPYEFNFNRKPPFQMTDLETASGDRLGGNTPKTDHAAIINEYGWLWLNRDGTPTVLTKGVYDHLLGPDVTDEERFALNAYYLGGLTEFWRAHRQFAGVLHFVYLTSSYPGAFTSDHFRNVRKPELEPHFADYVGEAFKPLGVYLNFWQPTLEPFAERAFTVMLVNDLADPVAGTLALSLETAGGKLVARAEGRFALEGLGQQTRELSLKVPNVVGKHVLKLTAQPSRPIPGGNTVCRRQVDIAPAPYTAAPAKARIVLVGDSTVADGSGWGPAFGKLLGPGAACINLARSGRSSKSYINEGHWKKALGEKPDYVLVQFGHNDMPGKGPERETDPKSTFPQYLGRYVDEARALGAKPILVTPMTRRNFQDGNIRDDLAAYAEAVKRVAAAKKVPLVDLHARSIALVEKLGPKAADKLGPMKDGKPDRTHLSAEGGRVMAELVAEELRAAEPALAPSLR